MRSPGDCGRGSGGGVSRLAEQMLGAKARAFEARLRGREARSLASIERSLRRTLAWFVQGPEPGPGSWAGFRLAEGRAGEFGVWQGERRLPVSIPYLQSLFEEAGVVPGAGQVILLDAVLVRMLVEEARDALTRDLAASRDQEGRLQEALYELEALEAGEGGRPPAPALLAEPGGRRPPRNDTGGGSPATG